jgi:hypothetical protein
MPRHLEEARTPSRRASFPRRRRCASLADPSRPRRRSEGWCRDRCGTAAERPPDEGRGHSRRLPTCRQAATSTGSLASYLRAAGRSATCAAPAATVVPRRSSTLPGLLADSGPLWPVCSPTTRRAPSSTPLLHGRPAPPEPQRRQRPRLMRLCLAHVPIMCAAGPRRPPCAHPTAGSGLHRPSATLTAPRQRARACKEPPLVRRTDGACIRAGPAAQVDEPVPAPCGDHAPSTEAVALDPDPPARATLDARRSDRSSSVLLRPPLSRMTQLPRTNRRTSSASSHTPPDRFPPRHPPVGSPRRRVHRDATRKRSGSPADGRSAMLAPGRPPSRAPRGTGGRPPKSTTNPAGSSRCPRCGPCNEEAAPAGPRSLACRCSP